jgi:pyruvate/2-oxoglutarate dehydrogenase complex dihydrolipoamide dehydrogenase (E3) component
LNKRCRAVHVPRTHYTGCYAVRALQAFAHQFRDALRSGRFGNRADLLKVSLYDWMMAQAKVSLRLAGSFEREVNELNVDIHQGYGELLDHRMSKSLAEKGRMSLSLRIT